MNWEIIMEPFYDDEGQATEPYQETHWLKFGNPTNTRFRLLAKIIKHDLIKPKFTTHCNGYYVGTFMTLEEAKSQAIKKLEYFVVEMEETIKEFKSVSIQSA